MIHLAMMKELPKTLQELPPLEKIVWLWVKHNGKKDYSVRELVLSLGLSIAGVHRAWRVLLNEGWIQQHRAPAGRTPGEYSANMQPVHPPTPTPTPLPTPLLEPTE
jgi:DNA-binding transcriptional MocR family regulator